MQPNKTSATDHFRSVISRGVSLVDFSAHWCAPCRTQQPIVEKLSETFKGRATSVVIDVDENPQLAMQLGIASIPTLIIFKDGKEVARFVGLQGEKSISEAVEKTLV